MSAESLSIETQLQELRQIIRRYWGFRELRPMQEQAMRAVLERRDSLVVMPTGGGKSLCFQAPAFYRQRETTVVVSPLIALMKDQVDHLRALGIPAVHLDSSLSLEEQSDVVAELRRGMYRLVYVSPERLALPFFQSLLQKLKVRTFAIDEAHCISHWGHDFRPEYRQLDLLREILPDATFHGYTATATERVRGDIVKQLNLRDPQIFVGQFDRPNLTYRVIPRGSVLRQVQEVIERHPREAGIIYCIRRKDVDELTAKLRELGYPALPYHAGMTPEQRRETQEAFRAETCDLVVATVAFGMGIDRPNVRFVLHTGMPKSVEHYQQEAGRAGRDGLEAECVLLFSGSDFMTWKGIIEKSTEENAVDPHFLPESMRQLDEMMRYCKGAVCRHRALVEHFGQRYESANCQACDICLQEVDVEPDALVIAQKILSCVARVQERFGVQHVVAVLRGESNERITRLQHHQLSTFGLLANESANQIRDWIYQLIGQQVLCQTNGEYPVLRLNDASWEVMRKQREVRLLRSAKKKKVQERANVSMPRLSFSEAPARGGTDQELMERLKSWRRRTAAEKGWPPYAVFSDETLRELVQFRPSSLERLRSIYGIGETRLRNFGAEILEIIQTYYRETGRSLDAAGHKI